MTDKQREEFKERAKQQWQKFLNEQKMSGSVRYELTPEQKEKYLDMLERGEIQF